MTSRQNVKQTKWQDDKLTKQQAEQIDKLTKQQSEQNDKLTKWQTDKTASWTERQVDKMTNWQNSKLIRTASWQNDKLTKQQADRMTRRQNNELRKWQVDKITSCQVDEMTKLQDDKLTKWQADEITNSPFNFSIERSGPRGHHPHHPEGVGHHLGLRRPASRRRLHRLPAQKSAQSQVSVVDADAHSDRAHVLHVSMT